MFNKKGHDDYISSRFVHYFGLCQEKKRDLWLVAHGHPENVEWGENIQKKQATRAKNNKGRLWSKTNVLAPPLLFAACSRGNFFTAGTYGTVLRTLMPLVIGDDELREGLDVLEQALAAVPGGRA